MHVTNIVAGDDEGNDVLGFLTKMMKKVYEILYIMIIVLQIKQMDTEKCYIYQKQMARFI